MTPECNEAARSMADYAIGLADNLTRARCEGLSEGERWNSEVRAMMCLVKIGREAPMLRALMKEADAEARAKLQNLKEVA